MNRLTLLLALALLLSTAAWGQTTTYASPVKIMNTPVPVNGTVTVTPSGGTMPVSGSVAVTGSVGVTGTPTVKIDPANNAVRTAMPNAFTRRFSGNLIINGEDRGEVALPDLPSGSLIEIESVYANCETAASEEIRFFSVKVVPVGSSTQYQHYLPLARSDSGLVPGGTAAWNYVSSGKIYAEPGTDLSISGVRNVAGGSVLSCRFYLYGRVY